MHVENAISTLCKFAKYSADVLCNKHTETLSLLKVIQEREVSPDFLQSLQIIKLQIKLEPVDHNSYHAEQKAAIIATINKIMASGPVQLLGVRVEKNPELATRASQNWNLDLGGKLTFSPFDHDLLKKYHDLVRGEEVTVADGNTLVGMTKMLSDLRLLERKGVEPFFAKLIARETHLVAEYETLYELFRYLQPYFVRNQLLMIRSALCKLQPPPETKSIIFSMQQMIHKACLSFLKSHGDILRCISRCLQAENNLEGYLNYFVDRADYALADSFPKMNSLNSQDRAFLLTYDYSHLPRTKSSLVYALKDMCREFLTGDAPVDAFDPFFELPIIKELNFDSPYFLYIFGTAAALKAHAKKALHFLDMCKAVTKDQSLLSEIKAARAVILRLDDDPQAFRLFSELSDSVNPSINLFAKLCVIDFLFAQGKKKELSTQVGQIENKLGESYRWLLVLLGKYSDDDSELTRLLTAEKWEIGPLFFLNRALTCDPVLSWRKHFCTIVETNRKKVMQSLPKLARSEEQLEESQTLDDYEKLVQELSDGCAKTLLIAYRRLYDRQLVACKKAITGFLEASRLHAEYKAEAAKQPFRLTYKAITLMSNDWTVYSKGKYQDLAFGAREWWSSNRSEYFVEVWVVEDEDINSKGIINKIKNNRALLGLSTENIVGQYGVCLTFKSKDANVHAMRNRFLQLFFLDVGLAEKNYFTIMMTLYVPKQFHGV